MKKFPLLLSVLLAISLSASATEEKSGSKALDETKPEVSAKAEHATFNPAEIKWIDGPPSLPRGSQMAVLEGDPAKEGPFTMRLKVPDGYRIPPHTHPAVEHVTVISGTFHLGMGDKFDQANAREMAAGSFAFMPPNMTHFAWAKGETIVQVHGIGPWKIVYVNPADDPRKPGK